MFVNREESREADNKNVNFPTQFCLESISDKFCAIDSRDVSLKGNVYDFSDDYVIDKSDILSIHKSIYWLRII